LPTAHFEAARSADALKKYVMKEETAAGPKTERSNPVPHYSAHEICLLLAQTSRQTDTGFWPRARELLRETPELAGQLMNPSLRGFFEKTQEVWMERAAIVLQQPTGTPPCDCDRDECMDCYEQELAYMADHDAKVAAINIKDAIPSPSTGSEETDEEASGSPWAPAPRPRLHSDNAQSSVIVHQ